MANVPLHPILWRFWRSRHRANTNAHQGFTLTELLVTVFISSGIIAGAMFLVTELTSTNQREAARNETQRDMQNALDYIASELREASFVYTGDCMAGNTTPSGEGCPGLLDRLPASLNSPTNTPVLAFWKNDLLPTEVRQRCAAGNPPSDASGNLANCSNGHAYALIVYSLNTANPNDTWDGRARITRYELSPFNNNAAPVPGYIPPALDADGTPLFRIWPNDLEGPRSAPPPQDTSAVLVDFVDTELEGNEKFREANNPCPSDDYNITPSTAPFRSFYACVLEPVNADGSLNINEGEQSVDVLVHLRGNAYGKPGIFNEDAFITGLETRVFTRSGVDKAPGNAN